MFESVGQFRRDETHPAATSPAMSVANIPGAQDASPLFLRIGSGRTTRCIATACVRVIDLDCNAGCRAGCIGCYDDNGVG